MNDQRERKKPFQRKHARDASNFTSVKDDLSEWRCRDVEQYAKPLCLWEAAAKSGNLRAGICNSFD